MPCAAPTSCAAVASAPNSKANAVSADQPSPDASTAKTFRLGSTDSCSAPTLASATSPSPASSTRPAVAASTARGTHGGCATVAMSSPDASAPTRSSSPSRIGATATDSTTGPGTHQRPSRSMATTRSTGWASMPSNFSGTISAVTPRSVSWAHTLRAGAVSPSAHDRTAVGRSAAPRAASMLAAKSRCCSSISKFTSIYFRGRPSSRSAMMLR